MITEAHPHLRQNTQREVRARTYQIHAVRCTSCHRNRDVYILPRRNRQEEKSKSKEKKNTNPKGKGEEHRKMFGSGKKAIESKTSRRETHKQGNAQLFADCRLALYERCVEQGQEHEI